MEIPTKRYRSDIFSHILAGEAVGRSVMMDEVVVTRDQQIIDGLNHDGLAQRCESWRDVGEMRVFWGRDDRGETWRVDVFRS
jgi:hypothetical protein